MGKIMEFILDMLISAAVEAYPHIAVLIMFLMLYFVYKDIKKFQYLDLDIEEARFKANKYKYGMYKSMRKMAGEEE
jgi:hypothetical protein